MGTSIAANPTSSMISATASIMPVRIPEAHKLWDPSRNVVSTKSHVHSAILLRNC